MMSDQEVRLRCFELALNNIRRDDGDTQLDDVFEYANKIYNFTCGCVDDFPYDRVTLLGNNKKVKI